MIYAHLTETACFSRPGRVQTLSGGAVLASVCQQTRSEIEYYLKSPRTLRFRRPPGISTQMLYALIASGKLNARTIYTLELYHSTVEWVICSLGEYRQHGRYTTWYSGSNTIIKLLPNLRLVRVLKDEGVRGRIWWNELWTVWARDALRALIDHEELEVSFCWGPGASQTSVTEEMNVMSSRWEGRIFRSKPRWTRVKAKLVKWKRDSFSR